MSLQPDIRLLVEELVLRGFDPADRARIASALQLELTSLLANPDAHASLGASAQVRGLDGGSFQVPAHANPEAIGAQVARSVYRTLQR